MDFEQFLVTHDLKDKPCHIWNTDKSGFSLYHVPGKVVTLLGSKFVYEVTGSSKEQITTLGAISTTGTFIGPMHIFLGQQFQGCNPMQNCVAGAYFGRSLKGWITSELF